MHHLFPYLATTTRRAVLFSLALLAPALPLYAKDSFLQYLQESANHGDAESQFILALAYRDGWDGTIKAGSIAARWCDLAAELNDPRPAFVLSRLQKEHYKIEPDQAKAMACLTQAASQGDNYARVILGELLLVGSGVPADWPRGAEWIRKSAHAGFSPAQLRLGMIFLIGDTATPKNEIEALAWFIVAAEAGSKPAEILRDERTQLLGREVAYHAVMLSRTLLSKTATASTGGG